jgi:hypothetical protein
VRDGLEERVLHLVDLPEARGRLPLDLERPFELRRPSRLGHVDPHALPVEGGAVLVVDQDRSVVHPDDAAVTRDQPVLDVEDALEPLGLVARLEHAVSVVGVQERGPERR